MTKRGFCSSLARDRASHSLPEDVSVATFRVRLMGPITEIVGKNLLDIEAQEGATLSDVFTEVGRQYGEGVREKILAPDGDFHPWVLVSVNGTDIKGLEGINTRLKDGDGILVALAIVGG